MTQKWNLQDIRPAEPRKPRAPQTNINRPMTTVSEATPPVRLEREEIPSIVIEDGTKKESKRLVLSVIIFLVVVGSAIGISALLGRTELTIYPEFREPNISSEFTAYPDKRTDSLSYEIMTLEATSESQIAASGEIEVQEKARGTIEIVKTTPGAERLIANTRFRTPEGLVFRIESPIVVPGAVADDSGTSVPGTIQAEVVADQIGEEYNVAANTRFDVPGFQESGLNDLYQAIYAQNKSAFTGGFNGKQFKIDEANLATARQGLQVALRDQLLARIETEKPSGFITFPGAVAITYNQLPAVEYGQDLATIREQAILQVPLFNATEFGSFLANEAVATYEGGPVRVEDITVLNFEYTSASTSFSVLADLPSLTFKLTGKPKLIWEYDAESLRENLAGLPKTSINNAIAGYPGIEGASVSITPFWKRSFPNNPEDITIIEELRAPE